MSSRVIIGDCRAVLTTLEAGSVQTCVTSPPYWGLRDYGHAGQIGLESTPAEYVAEMVAVFREVRRVLRDDGTLWLNLGDSYVANRGNTAEKPGHDNKAVHEELFIRKHKIPGKPKDLVGIPWRVAFALQADGWYLRQDIIWSKPNPMPESVHDRCTKAHEYLFLLAKSERYYYDADAIAEPLAETSIERLGQNVAEQRGSERVPGKTNGTMKAVARATDTYTGRAYEHPQSAPRGPASNFGIFDKRNKRSVWTVTTQPFKGAHFATFPPALIEPCILAGSKPGDTVLDPFGGSGTTGQVSEALGRKWLLIELNGEYGKLCADRTRQIGMELVCGS